MRLFSLLLALSLSGCSAFTLTGEDCTLAITNGTSATLWFLYVRESGDAWGDDVLEDGRLDDAATHTLTVPPGDYDVQGEWPSPGSETFTRLDAATCNDGDSLGLTLSLSDQD